MHIASGPFEQASAVDFVGIEYLTHEEPEDIRDKCDRQLSARPAKHRKVQAADIVSAELKPAYRPSPVSEKNDTKKISAGTFAILAH